MNNCPDTGSKKELRRWVRQLWSWWISEVQHSKQIEAENKELRAENRRLKKSLHAKNSA